MDPLFPPQNYLPQVYSELDADAARCVLYFDRLALKSALINEVVGQTNGIPEALHAAASETLVGTCEVRQVTPLPCNLLC